MPGIFSPEELKPPLPRGTGGVSLQPSPTPWTTPVRVSSRVLPGSVLPSHQTSGLSHLEGEDQTTLQGSDLNSKPQRVGLWPANATSTGTAQQAGGGEAGLSHRRTTYKAVSKTSLACLILITPLGVGCYYSILLGANKIMLRSHYIPIRNLLRTHSTRVRRRKCLGQPHQPGPRQREGRAWSGERGHREWRGGAGVCPQGGLPELEPARHQGERWAGARRTGMGVRVRLREGPKAADWEKPPGVTLLLVQMGELRPR